MRMQKRFKENEYTDEQTLEWIKSGMIIIPNPQGCIFWKGAHSHGRPHFKYKGKSVSVVNWLYDKKNSPISVLREHCHSCHNAACINEDHIYEGTHSQNITDMYTIGKGRKLKTHCPKGHEYTEDNIYYWTDHKGFTNRNCKECKRSK